LAVVTPFAVPPWVVPGLQAGAVAGVVSGVPSTLHALWHHGGVLTAARAAGALLGEPRLGRGLLVHTTLSLGWGVALAAVLPARHRVATGTLAGVVIAALDLGIVGRHLPEIRSLPGAPQVLDHVAFGLAAGTALSHLSRRQRRGATPVSVASSCPVPR
jgi:hypothetical protein